MDCGTDVRVADAEPPFEQRLRAAGAEQRGVHRGGDDPSDTEAAGEGSMNLTKQALRREGRSPRPRRSGREEDVTAKTLLMALGVGVVVGVLLGIPLVGLIGGNREQAAPSTAPPPRTVTVEETVETTVETTVEKTVPATTPDVTPATATATATAYP